METNAFHTQTVLITDKLAFQYRPQNAPDDLTAERRPYASGCAFGQCLANRLAAPTAAGATRAPTRLFALGFFLCRSSFLGEALIFGFTHPALRPLSQDLVGALAVDRLVVLCTNGAG